MLLQPNKNANPDLTILAASSFMLKRLKRLKLELYSDLYQELLSHDKNAGALMDAALSFLYLLGLVEYHAKNDLIEYTGR